MKDFDAWMAEAGKPQQSDAAAPTITVHIETHGDSSESTRRAILQAMQEVAERGHPRRCSVVEWPAGEQFMPANWPAGFTWPGHPVDALKALGEMHGLSLPPEAEAEMRALCDAPVDVIQRGEVDGVESLFFGTEEVWPKLEHSVRGIEAKPGPKLGDRVRIICMEPQELYMRSGVLEEFSSTAWCIVRLDDGGAAAVAAADLEALPDLDPVGLLSSLSPPKTYFDRPDGTRVFCSGRVELTPREA